MRVALLEPKKRKKRIIRRGLVHPTSKLTPVRRAMLRDKTLLQLGVREVKLWVVVLIRRMIGYSALDVMGSIGIVSVARILGLVSLASNMGTG